MVGGVSEMATWFFEPGHTAAMFRARHMMVTYVRGHFKNVSGSLVFDPENPAQSSADVTIDAGTIWTGQPQRDAHLRSADFLDVENHPRITFKGNQVEVAGARDYILRGALTIRGVSREVELNVSYLGQWLTPWWEEEGEHGSTRVRRCGPDSSQRPGSTATISASAGMMSLIKAGSLSATRSTSRSTQRRYWKDRTKVTRDDGYFSHRREHPTGAVF